MRVSVIGCGRWGSLIAWYLDSVGHEVTLCGRASSKHMQRFLRERRNDLLTLPQSISLSTSYECVRSCEALIISVPSQSLRSLLEELRGLGIKDTTVILCMKGLEIETGLRLSEVAESILPGSCPVCVWLGPGHVQEFYAGVPNCMVIDSRHEEVKRRLVGAFSSPLIRFYYGNDLIGNELGAAVKNVIGIAAGILDGLKLGTLKGALMSRGTHEVARLIGAMGGNPFSAYGLCHLGDYEATVFSPYSHNRCFGEAIVTGGKSEGLAEGYYTADAVMRLSRKMNVDMPICAAVYDVLYGHLDPKEAVGRLFERSIKNELITEETNADL